MECPNCSAELVELKDRDDSILRRCPGCGGLWIDVADLDRLLLRHNLPGLKSLGGRVDQDALSGNCPDCQVDMVKVIGGDKSSPRSYTTCESCGGIFFEDNFGELADFGAAEKAIIVFFSDFNKAITKASGY